jgi:phosphoribosyl 1,2-cyclic phosphodiesterase
MRVTVWGTRGSVASAGPETVRYGGNTSCLEVRNDAGALVVLDAGTGIRRLGATVGSETTRVDVLLTHLHMDHIQGLGFFECLHWPELEVHLWGPASMTLGLHARLSRYLSPPLFPVRLRDLACDLTVHDVPRNGVEIPGFHVETALVCHPGPTVGYRLHGDGATLAYLPDHEPMLCASGFAAGPRSTSGFDLAADVDLLIHDAQYTADEYKSRIGWGHSAIHHAFAFAAAVGARQFMPFHHDPTHDDATLDMIYATSQSAPMDFDGDIVPATEGLTIDLTT